MALIPPLLVRGQTNRLGSRLENCLLWVAESCLVAFHLVPLSHILTEQVGPTLGQAFYQVTAHYDLCIQTANPCYSGQQRQFKF